jgi:hypothetical protein
VPETDGDDREAAIEEYLLLAKECERSANLSKGDDRRSWEEMAMRWRALAAALRGER